MFLRRTLALSLFSALTLAVVLSGESDTSAAENEIKKEKDKAKRALLKKLLESKKDDSTTTKQAEGTAAAAKVPVPAKARDSKALSAFIDSEINKAIEAAKLPVATKTSDAEFVRRVSLDIAGVIPSVEMTTAFLDSKEPDKRAKLIDELLASANYGQHMSDIWTGLMFLVDSDNRNVSKEPLAKWLKENFNENKPWDKMAHEVLVGTGTPAEHGEVVYYLSNRGVDKMTDSVGKLFLGIQLQCAQCHNHPFTSWKQTEYWGMAQFFYRVDASVKKTGTDKKTIESSVTEKNSPNRKKNALPESAKNVNPKFLGGPEVKLNSSEPARPVLAKWVTSPENPYFAKAIVNRIWAQYMGRGFVNPVDDMLEENPASHPELLTSLAGEFIAGGHDLKSLIRAICNSETYQRSSRPVAKSDERLYSHQAIKTLSPEQLYDSIISVTGYQRPVGKEAKGGQQKGPITPRDRFVQFFLPSDGAKPTEYDSGIPQALRLMNAPNLNTSPALIREITKNSPDKAVEKLYLRVLSRRPSEDEMAKMRDYINKQSDATSAYADILWVLLNGSEFALNR